MENSFINSAIPLHHKISYKIIWESEDDENPVIVSPCPSLEIRNKIAWTKMKWHSTTNKLHSYPRWNKE